MIQIIVGDYIIILWYMLCVFVKVPVLVALCILHLGEIPFLWFCYISGVFTLSGPGDVAPG